MALDTVVKNMGDGLIVMKDATGVPISAPIQFTNGDLAISGLRKKLRNVAYYQARGVFISARHTDRFFPTFSFTSFFTGFTNATAGLASDAVMQAGGWAAGVSTLGASADVWATTLVFTSEGTDYGGTDGTFTLTSCDCTLDFAEGDSNMLTINGTVLGAITGDLAAS